MCTIVSTAISYKALSFEAFFYDASFLSYERSKSRPMRAVAQMARASPDEPIGSSSFARNSRPAHGIKIFQRENFIGFSLSIRPHDIRMVTLENLDDLAYPLVTRKQIVQSNRITENVRAVYFNAKKNFGTPCRYLRVRAKCTTVGRTRVSRLLWNTLIRLS